MLYRSRASVTGSIPHSYGSSFTLLYFSECSRLENTSVNSAKPVATTTKMAMGMYAESMWVQTAAETAHAAHERSRAVYITRQRAGAICRNSQKLNNFSVP